jgi:hypothetical protein
MRIRNRLTAEPTITLRGSIVRLAAALALAVVIFGGGPVASTSASGPAIRVPRQHSAIPGTMIACFHRKIRRFIGKVEPWKCEIAGHIESAGHGEEGPGGHAEIGSFARFPIKGYWERIEWDEWGENKSSGEEAVNAHTGKQVRLTPSRRVRCADGSTWYSKISVFNIQNGYDFVVRLPVCNDPALIR